MQPLRLLIVEDEELDAELVLLELRRSGWEPTHRRVDTPEALREALASSTWDIVISDYSMPRFSAPAAFAMVQAAGLDLPFIIVSGTVGEETAVEAMRSGVHDYLLKGHLARLSVAVQRELREAENRAQQRRMQEQLLLSDRMASMGMLAAGVAHEINNPLAAVVANLEFACQDLTALAAPTSQLQPLVEELSDAREAANRIRDILRDLRVFARPKDDHRELVSITAVLDSTLRMAWTEVRHRAKLLKSYEAVPPVWGSASRLGQVFLNLVINAAQAIPEGRAGENEIRVTARADGAGHVVVEVADTGEGIPEASLGKLFQTFYTTKPAGVGTGLGLAICREIVSGLGGTISVTSRLGEGATFRVQLPVADQKSVEPAPAVAPPRPAVRRGKILVVDDDPMITRVIAKALSAEHELVIELAARGALGRIEAGERFDVILCDLMMPNVTGMELYESVLAKAPDQAERMIFLTGGGFTPRAREFLEKMPNAHVDKPFDAHQLRAIVNDRIY
jgi:signal transduction histidine kinase